MILIAFSQDVRKLLAEEAKPLTYRAPRESRGPD